MKNDRFAETIKLKKEKRIVSVTLTPSIIDCRGEIYFTDLMIQEGRLSGYTPHTEIMLKNAPTPIHYHSGIVRSGETVIIFNLGETSTGLDCYIYPNQTMSARSISVSQGAGSHKATFLSSASAGDEFTLIASKRQCLKNTNTIEKTGFYQYTAASDSKHQIKLEEHKSARVYFEYKEMLQGNKKL